MPIKIWTQDNYARNSEKWVGANSLALTGKFFLKRTGNIIDKAGASDRIIWVNYTEETFASDNETVAKATVEFEPKETQVTYIAEISGGTITVADEGKFYNLSDADTVNGATESTVPYYVDTVAGSATDPVISMQLQLVKFISATKGEFKIVNL